MHNTADTIFYKNYILHYVNILHHLDHDLGTHNNRIEHIKSTLHIKCRNFISVLHILARSRIPESILDADIFSNILHGVSQYLHKDNVYTLLYGTAVNQQSWQIGLLWPFNVNKLSIYLVWKS